MLVFIRPVLPRYKSRYLLIQKPSKCWVQLMQKLARETPTKLLGPYQVKLGAGKIVVEEKLQYLNGKSYFGKLSHEKLK